MVLILSIPASFYDPIMYIYVETRLAFLGAYASEVLSEREFYVQL